MKLSIWLLKIFSNECVHILSCFEGTERALENVAVWELYSDSGPGMMRLISDSIKFLASFVLEFGGFFLLAKESHRGCLSLGSFEFFAGQI